MKQVSSPPLSVLQKSHRILGSWSCPDSLFLLVEKWLNKTSPDVPSGINSLSSLLLVSQDKVVHRVLKREFNFCREELSPITGHTTMRVSVNSLSLSFSILYYHRKHLDLEDRIHLSVAESLPIFPFDLDITWKSSKWANNIIAKIQIQ